MIFRKSFEADEMEWKTAHIVPIDKNDPKCDPLNYLPVSLTSMVCKIMESLIEDKLIKLLEENNIISLNQHGFVAGRSCLTNLLEMLENWTMAPGEGWHTDVLYLDYRKAVGSVPLKRKDLWRN